jgi:CRP/FNR family transcriptional regulator, anaerobic regulatory protein
MLKHFDFFTRLSGESRSLLENRIRFYTFNGKKILINKGDMVSGVYLIEEGGLRVFSISSNNKEITLYTINPGESCILAMNCVFSDILYPAWVENEKQVTKIAVIPSPVYKKLHESEPAIQQFTIDVLAARIFDLMSSMEEISCLPLEKRLANFLLKNSSSSCQISMNHEKIASHLGTAREVVTRNLNNLVKMGLITVERGYSKILSVEKLRTFIDTD